jgi:hypothetical protein
MNLTSTQVAALQTILAAGVFTQLDVRGGRVGAGQVSRRTLAALRCAGLVDVETLAPGVVRAPNQTRRNSWTATVARDRATRRIVVTAAGCRALAQLGG